MAVKESIISLTFPRGGFHIEAAYFAEQLSKAEADIVEIECPDMNSTLQVIYCAAFFGVARQQTLQGRIRIELSQPLRQRLQNPSERLSQLPGHYSHTDNQKTATICSPQCDTTEMLLEK